LDEPDRIRDKRERHRADILHERRSQTAQKQAADLDLFLDALRRRIETLSDIGHILEADEDNPPRFIDYARTRNLTSECLAFMIVIDRRIDGLPEGLRQPRRDTFDDHTILLWGTLLECSLAFLRAISEQEHLPLGSREVFLREIKTLHDAHAILAQDRFSGKLPQGTLTKHHQAERILNEIIDRAPRLLDLG